MQMGLKANTIAILYDFPDMSKHYKPLCLFSSLTHQHFLNDGGSWRWDCLANQWQIVVFHDRAIYNFLMLLNKIKDIK